MFTSYHIIFQIWMPPYTSLKTLEPGVPHEVLMQDFWVPGSTSRLDLDRFRGKQAFRKILTTTDQTCLKYFERATGDTLPQFKVRSYFWNLLNLFGPNLEKYKTVFCIQCVAWLSHNALSNTCPGFRQEGLEECPSEVEGDGLDVQTKVHV